MAMRTKYTPEIVAKAKEYVDNWEALGDAVPMICSLALHCGVNKDTIYTWEKEEKEKGGETPISDVCARVRESQEKALINKGLRRESEASLSKLLLMKHGYSDRVEQDVKSTDGSMSPTEEARKAAKKRILEEFGDN